MMRNALPIAGALLALLLISYCATRAIDNTETTTLTDPNLPTIRYIGRENPDLRFRFDDRPRSDNRNR